MFKKSLKAIIISIFVTSMFSTAMVCSADETTAMTNNKLEKFTTFDMTTHTTLTTEIDTNNETSDVVTTSPISTLDTNITTDTDISYSYTEITSDETTTTEITSTSQTTTEAITSTDVEGNDLMFYDNLSYVEKLISIQNGVDKYLYNVSLSPDKNLVLAKKYIRTIAVLNDIASNDILYLNKYATKITALQNQAIELNNTFYDNIEKAIDRVTYKNYSSIEVYCKNLITTAFNDGIISCKETLTMLNSIHDKIMDCLTEEDLELAKYYNYEFISDQSYLSQWNDYYPDMKGWIYIDGVDIDSPLMQPPYEDNEYYLQHSWDGYPSSRGTIELDYRCSLTESNDPYVTNTVLIYGHNLSDGTMFSNLAYYKDKSYWEEHPLIEISTENEQRLYKIYATCSIYGLNDGTQFKYWDSKYIYMDEELFNEHIQLTKETMLYDTESFPEFGDDILTLQTCDGNDGWRIVLFAKRVK